MNKLFPIAGILLTLTAGSFVTQAQTKSPEVPKEVPKGWHLLDRTKDGFYGIASEKTYETLLKDKKPKKMVVVAVIDSGVNVVVEVLRDMGRLDEYDAKHRCFPVIE